MFVSHIEVIHWYFWLKFGIHTNLSNVQNRNIHQIWSKTQFFMFPSQFINDLSFLWPCIICFGADTFFTSFKKSSCSKIHWRWCINHQKSIYCNYVTLELCKNPFSHCCGNRNLDYEIVLLWQWWILFLIKNSDWSARSPTKKTNVLWSSF